MTLVLHESPMAVLTGVKATILCSCEWASWASVMGKGLMAGEVWRTAVGVAATVVAARARAVVMMLAYIMKIMRYWYRLRLVGYCKKLREGRVTICH